MNAQTAPLTEDATRLLDRLTRYAAPITIKNLAAAANLSRRETEQGIEELRRAGQPIATSCAGVTLAVSADELHVSNASLQRRIVSQYLSLRAARTTERAMRDAERGIQRPTLWRDAA